MTELQVVRDTGEVTPQRWQHMLSQAQTFVRSGLLPNSVKTPEQAVVIMLKGRELGMQPMQAFNHINVIQGKPTLSAEAMLAQIQRVHPAAKVEYERLDNEACVIIATRPNHAPVKISFTMEDAKRAGLTGKDNWHKFPRAMLRSRCISEMARSVFPDALMGASYTPEELAPDLAVDGDLQVVETPVRRIEKKAPPVEHYDSENSLHQTRLRAQLKTFGQDHLFHFVSEEMRGLPMTQASVVTAIAGAQERLALAVMDEAGDPEA